MTNRIEIQMESEDLLADSSFNIMIEKLIPNRKYDLHLRLVNYYCINGPMQLDPNINWFSKVTISADEWGKINLNHSCGSSDTSVSANLFFSSQPEKIKKVKLPEKLEDISTKDKFQMVFSLYLNQELIAEKSFERYYQLPSIISKNVVLGQAYGRIFYDERKGQQPAIIIVSGSDGRIEKAQNIAQLLASRGFVALAVSYFGLAGLPKNLERIPLEILDESAQYLSSLPQVDGNRIGLYGRSKGAELALLASTYFQHFKCLVVNSPSSVVLEGINGWRNSRSSSWTYKGREIPYVKFQLKDFLLAKLKKQTFFKEQAEAEIAVEKYQGALLCIGAKHDEIWNSGSSIEQIAKRMKDRKHAAGIFETKIYENCGHMLTVAYQPNNRYKKKFSPRLNLKDSVSSWEQTVLFFHEHL